MMQSSDGDGVSKMYSVRDTGGSVFQTLKEISIGGADHEVAVDRKIDGGLAWYCARTKPKHEHIAAANLRQNLGLEVFHPRLRIERATQRGVMRVVEPLFPCYVFIRCVLDENFSEIRHTSGISSLVHFGQKIPTVPDSIIEELRECFEADDPMTVEDRISPADEVIFVEGAFTGMRAFVLRIMPAKKRVQVLLEVLGGPTPVEVERSAVVLERSTLADFVPVLAAPSQKLELA
ncbi:MAG: transcriptional activator RfaH [Verrucomicrobiia bacterium]